MGFVSAKWCNFLFLVLLLSQFYTRIVFGHIVNVPIHPNSEEFMRVIAQRENSLLRDSSLSSPPHEWQIGVKQFVSIGHLRPAQHRYAEFHVISTLPKDLEKFAQSIDGGENSFRLINDDGRSLFPLQDARKGVLTDFGIVMVDGHHSVLTSLYSGAVTLPIILIEDYRSLTREDVFSKIESDNLAYLIDLDGKRNLPPLRFSELKDDPNRSLISLTGLNVRQTEGEFSYFYGSELQPLWIKMGESIPFVEFILADILYQRGIAFTAEAFGELKSNMSSRVEDVRSTLVGVIGDKRLDGLPIVVRAMSANDLITMVKKGGIRGLTASGVVVIK